MSSSKPSSSPETEHGPHRWRGLLALLSANAVAWTGTRLAGIALPWFVLTTTGSPLRTGAVAFAQMGPYIISQALAGPIIDRVGPRRVSMVCDIVVAVGIGSIPLLFGLDLLPFPLLLGILAVVGTADGPANSAKSVFIPEVTEQAGVPLERTTGLVSTVERTASTVGPAVAGVVVAAWGAATSLWITAGLAAAGAVIIAIGMPRREPKPVTEESRYLTELKEGAVYLRQEPLLRAMYGMILVTNLIDTAVFSVLLPVWAEQTGRGPAAIGLLASVMSGISIGSSLLAAAYGHRLPRRTVYLFGFLIGGAPRIIILALVVPLGAVVTVYAIAGFAIGFINPIVGAILFERVPSELLGRVRALGGSLAWAGIPFGGLIGGALVTAIGLSPALLILGVVYLAATTLPAFRPEWASMNR